MFKEGDMAKVASIQHKIFNMHATHAVAVKDTLSKSGSKTPGVDGVVWKTQKDKGEVVLQVRNIMYNLSKYEPKPVKRVWIPKDNGDVRPLGIPCMIDRAVQRVYIYGIDPISEIVSDQDSYGFRLGRSAGDAILSVRGKLIHPKSSEWVMEADIKNCFDQFDHDYLLKVCPLYRKVDRKVMDKWLKVCIIDKGKTYWPKTGTPQGGTISPVLCNLALNGLESTIKESIRTFRGKWQRNIKVHIVRYADDFIVVGQTREELESIIKPINKFLNERGLRLNLNKTRIRHISQGFNFLGFKIAKRRYKHWKRSDMKKHTSDDRIVVLPQPQKLKNFRLTYKNTIKKMYKGNITRLIITLNPLLRGLK